MSRNRYFRALTEIRKCYEMRVFAEIRKHYPGRIDPYFYDWMTIMTPIEKLVWHDIRTLGLPLYPQVPVGKYYVDFGDPVNKLGIEVDGAKWHADSERDKNRQRDIEGMGWEIIRIPGYAAHKMKEDFIDPNDEYMREDYTNLYEKYLSDSSEGILLSLIKTHYSAAPIIGFFYNGLLENRDYEMCYFDRT